MDIHLGTTLLRRLRIALEERFVQVEAFAAVNETLEEDLRREWETMVADWLADQTKPSPYAPSGNGA